MKKFLLLNPLEKTYHEYCSPFTQTPRSYRSRIRWIVYVINMDSVLNSTLVLTSMSSTCQVLIVATSTTRQHTVWHINRMKSVTSSDCLMLQVERLKAKWFFAICAVISVADPVAGLGGEKHEIYAAASPPPPGSATVFLRQTTYKMLGNASIACQFVMRVLLLNHFGHCVGLAKESCLRCHSTTRSNKYSRLIQFIEMNGIQFFDAN